MPSHHSARFLEFELLEVASAGKLQDAQRLVVHERVNVNCKDETGNTPLHQAAWGGHHDIVKLLVEHGGDVNASNDDGSTPLHWATWNGHVETVKWLLALATSTNENNKRARTQAFVVDAGNRYGDTCLHWAAERGFEEIVKLLLAHGCKPTAKNSSSWTPVHKAATPQIASLLQRGLSADDISVMEEDMKKRRKLTSMTEEISRKFFESGLLDFHEPMPDGFYDAGRNNFKSLEELQTEQSDREVILVDKTRDLRLVDILEKAEKFLEKFSDLELKIRMLSLFVSNVMGGSQVDDVTDQNDIAKLSQNVCDFVRSSLSLNVVPIGCVTHGLCRHRSILYKYLCDQLNIPCRLVRGDYDNQGHSWNVTFLGGKYYLVDVMHDPTELYPEGSEQATNYQRISRVNSRIANVGGMGGSSVRSSHDLQDQQPTRFVPLRDFKRADLVIYERLGSGAFGTVMRCSLNGFSCAVKIMKYNDDDETSDDQMLIQQELRIMQSLRHNNIVSYLGHDIRKNEIQLFMEYFPLNLETLVRHHREKLKKFLEPQQILFLALEVAKGLHYLHSLSPPIMHRDIKSSNVLLSCDSLTLDHGYHKIHRVVLCDFGVSKLLEKGTIGRTFVGTPGFMAPEVSLSPLSGGHSEKADVWSFGMMILSEVMSLQRPKGGVTNPTLPPEIQSSPQLAPIISLMKQCIVTKPQDRVTMAHVVFQLSTLPMMSHI